MAKKDRPLKKLSAKKRLRRIAELVEPFRVTSGKRFRLRDYDPDATPGVASKDDAQEYLKRGVELLAEMQDQLYAQDQWGVLLIFQAMDAAGKDGAIKHVMSGDQPAGLPGVRLQGADHGGARPRLPVAHVEVAARARPHRHLQPLVLRGGAGGARAPADPREAEAAEGARHEAGLGRALRGHPGFRALPRPPGLRDPQVLPERLEEGAEGPLPGAAREAGEELEVLAGRRPGAQALEAVHGRLPGRDRQDGGTGTRPGTWCRRTRSGSRGWSWRARSTRRSRS